MPLHASRHGLLFFCFLKMHKMFNLWCIICERIINVKRMKYHDFSAVIAYKDPIHEWRNIRLRFIRALIFINTRLVTRTNVSSSIFSMIFMSLHSWPLTNMNMTMMNKGKILSYARIVTITWLSYYPDLMCFISTGPRKSTNIFNWTSFIAVLAH